LTYPGVYVEEIPSGVHTIAGVATSITAFVGRAASGPVNDPRAISSYADFERMFGGVWDQSSLGDAVRDFYLNGGQQAIIVRLFHENPANDGIATINVQGLTVAAATPGSWGNSLRIRIDSDILPEFAAMLGVSQADVFNMTVHDTVAGTTETIRNVTVANSARRVDNVLATESTLVRIAGALGAGVLRANPDPQAGKSVWEDDAASTKVTTNGNDGQLLTSADLVGPGLESTKEGLYALEKADLFNLLCIPPYLAPDGDIEYAAVIDSAAAYCQRRRAMLIIDSPSSWTTKDAAKTGVASDIGSVNSNAAVFFPRLRRADPGRSGQVREFVPCGAVAGVFAQTDGTRGVWKAPAGLEAVLVNAPELSVALTDGDNGELNPLAINCLRTLPASGRVVWGARTRAGDDRLASEWKYIPVRRTALFLEESLYRGLQWVVFEPNDEPLWASIRLNVGAFMHNLFRQGAFEGTTPSQAYFVKCDGETTIQNDVDLGIVNILVGFAPLKPAEFVVLQIQQIAGQLVT
jgi:phage tail sheath protein FI